MTPRAPARPAPADGDALLASAAWPPVLTPDLCARLLGLGSGREAMKLARRRELPYVKRGKRVLFLTGSVVAHLRSLEQPAISDRDLTRKA